jgi:regulator of replication initiation timing
VKLKKTIANKNAERDQLRTDVPALVRAPNTLTLENQQFREHLARHQQTWFPSPPS